jgi:NAD(P)H-dependent flavin oxidoreductase YrpB (nitropropane dioxygenase family)
MDNKWKTRVTEMLGIKYPIIQGSFGGFGTSVLAVAVCEAGGLGMITANALKTPERLREDIRRLKSKTNKPFAVNLTMTMTPELDRMVDVVIEERVPVVETSAYRADAYGKKLQQAGIKWIHKVATVKHALAAEAQGADAVVIIGLEGTGFKNPSQLPSLIGIPWAARQMKVPIIAGGGIGDSRGFMAALAMGAEAVYMGTAFMTTKECPIPERYKQMLVEADPSDPRFRDRNLVPTRTEAYAKVLEKRGTMPEAQWLAQLEAALSHPSMDPEKLEAMFRGDEIEAILEFVPGSLAVAVIDKIMSVKELIESIIAGAEEIRKRWSLEA